MSDTEPTAAQPSEGQPDPAEVTAPAAPLPPPPATSVAAPPRVPIPLRDQVFGLRSLVAVGVAGVILGGLAGFGINAATGGDDRDGRMGRFGPQFREGPGGPGGRGGPGGFPQGPGGQLGPGQPAMPGTTQAPTQAPTPTPTPTPAPSS